LKKERLGNVDFTGNVTLGKLFRPVKKKYLESYGITEAMISQTMLKYPFVPRRTAIRILKCDVRWNKEHGGQK
jgi:hypothetical protein